jgi:outer membrane protein OmpA-like peptidoglycan-associated protein
VADKANRFSAARSVACSPVAPILTVGGYLSHEVIPFLEGDDFDTLLAASSFGSEQARAIRGQAPAAAREPARRVLADEEKCSLVRSNLAPALAYLRAASVPSVLFFGFNDAALEHSADIVLQPIAQWARSQHLTVSITGYAADGGSADYNFALSEQRANAVRDKLIGLGVPATQITHVTGVGTAGQPHDAICAYLRRVVIALSPIPEAPSGNLN